jgi:hypothetical protein
MDTQEENKRTKFFTALFTTVLLAIIGLLFATGDIVFAQNDERNIDYDLTGSVFGTNIELERSSRKPKVVHIKKGNYVYKVFTVETDIYKILEQYRIDITGNERISVSTEYIVDGTFVRVIHTETVIEDITLDIPFETEVIKTYQRFEGEEEVLQEGVLGTRTKRVQNYYEDGILKESAVLEESIAREPVKEIIEIGTSTYTFDGIELRGYNCPYWHNVINSGSYTEEEKEWLKFVMYCESGCNAESTKSYYKGLFQWDPKWWRKQYSENIYDGYAQIQHTIEKYRAGGENMWPNCNAKFEDGHRYRN